MFLEKEQNTNKQHLTNKQHRLGISYHQCGFSEKASIYIHTELIFFKTTITQ